MSDILSMFVLKKIRDEIEDLEFIIDKYMMEKQNGGTDEAIQSKSKR